MNREKIMSYKKEKDYSNEIAIDNTIDRSVHINKPGYRGSGNNRSCYINDYHNKTVYVPNTVCARIHARYSAATKNRRRKID